MSRFICNAFDQITVAAAVAGRESERFQHLPQSSSLAYPCFIIPCFRHRVLQIGKDFKLLGKPVLLKVARQRSIKWQSRRVPAR